ncbi:MAG: 2-dehydropantoate 2-reductase, partial [Acetatifactor sp.]|nr:2-dehydropantoate 2-reductase [Acetatifactor sp.]
DIKEGRKTEVRKINGAVIEAAKSKGISLPVNETIFNLVTALEGKF